MPDVPPINLPRGARITDVITYSLDELEELYYSHPIQYYSEDEFFSVSLIKRLFDDRRILMSRLETFEHQDKANTASKEILETMMMLTPTKLHRNTLADPVLLSPYPRCATTNGAELPLSNIPAPMVAQQPTHDVASLPSTREKRKREDCTAEHLKLKEDPGIDD